MYPTRTLSNTNNFEVWGGITPKAANFGISPLVDRLGFDLYEKMKVINAEYSVTSRHSGWYGYTTVDGELPTWLPEAQKAADTYLDRTFNNGPIKVKQIENLRPQ
jgi:hypothetical protein